MARASLRSGADLTSGLGYVRVASSLAPWADHCLGAVPMGFICSLSIVGGVWSWAYIVLLVLGAAQLALLSVTKPLQ